jgi:uncharacterized membrane protein
VTATIVGAPISGTKTATLTLATTATTTAGTYPITITGTSGSLVHTAIYTLTVAQAIPDFTIASATSSTALRYGQKTSIQYRLTVTPRFGFKGSVAMSATGTPSASTATWSPTAVNITSTAAGTTTYTLNVPANAPVGSYTVTFTGTSGSIVHTATAKITIS